MQILIITYKLSLFSNSSQKIKINVFCWSDDDEMYNHLQLTVSLKYLQKSLFNQLNLSVITPWQFTCSSTSLSRSSATTSFKVNHMNVLWEIIHGNVSKYSDQKEHCGCFGRGCYHSYWWDNEIPSSLRNTLSLECTPRIFSNSLYYTMTNSFISFN